jgi:hypothetical protein
MRVRLLRLAASAALTSLLLLPPDMAANRAGPPQRPARFRSVVVTAAVSAASPAATWRTCVPQATLGVGIYRIDNDLFTGSKDRSCIRASHGHALTILDNYAPEGASVVAYPSVRIGNFYRSRDNVPGLPARADRPGDIFLHLYSRGNAPGVWLADSDMWFYNSRRIRGHGREELVLVTRSHLYVTGCARELTIAGVLYCANRHRTGPAGHTWPLIVLRLVYPRYHLGVPVADVFRRLWRLHWLGGHRWLGSIAYGAECWSGCKGLYLSMTARLP